jgi:hypothetical protein
MKAMKSRQQNLQQRKDAQKIMDYKHLLLKMSYPLLSILDQPSLTSLHIYFVVEQL